jgi:serine/threonine protein kinase
VTLNLLNANMKSLEPILQTIKLIFKLQKNIQRDVDILQMEADHQEHCFRFELHGHSELRDEKRIVTLGIGENGGSKSKCYLLIYDDKMAVVVPPSISDMIEVAESSKSEETMFAEYLDAIQFCKKIAALLTGDGSAKTAIPCLVPSLELVIRKVEPFFNEGNLQIDPDDACINLLLTRKKYLRNCFKIGKKFAFFLHLVKRGTFLGNILATIHTGIREKADAGMQEYSRILENALASSHHPDDLIYRETHWEKMYSIYRNYEKAIKNLPTYAKIKRTGLDTRIFLEYVQGRFFQDNIDPNGTSVQGELKFLLDEIFRKPKNLNILEEFRRQQTVYIQEKVDSRYMNSYLEVIIWNYLELLVRLRRRKVAIRDIKPENIFLRRELRGFSGNDDNFIFGLIDLETAINLGAEGELAQPLTTLATPYYVQPTTFVKNEILRLIYRDEHLARIYYMQDWHSVVALIYHAITGETLFIDSAKLLLDEFNNRYVSLTSDKIDTKDIISMLNVFWPNALEEFNYKITKNRHVLEIIHLDISEDIWELLLGEIESNVQSIKEKLRTASDSFHPEQIQCLARMEIAELKKSLQPFKEEGDEAITCLLQIIECQEREQYYDQCLHKLNSVSKRMTAYELLTFMFAVEYDFFFPEELRAAAVKRVPLKKAAYKGDKTLQRGTTQKKTKTRSNKTLRLGALQ